jgi:hypothetical protein
LRSISEDRNYGTAFLPLQLHPPLLPLFAAQFMGKVSRHLRGMQGKSRHQEN